MRRTWTALSIALLVGCSSSDSPDGGSTTCMRATDCGEGLVCVQGSCKAAGSVGTSFACTASRDCISGDFCDAVMARCAVAGTGLVNAPCAGDNQCAAGLRCEFSGFGGTCTSGMLTDYGASCIDSKECLAGLYCGATRECQPLLTAFPPYAGTTCLPDSAAFHSYFEVPRSGVPPKDFFRLPYPNDIRVQAGVLDMTDFPRPGKTVLGVDLVDLYVDALASDFAGFSPMAPVSFRFSPGLDFPFFRENALGNVRFVDLDSQTELGGFNFLFSNGRTKLSCNDVLVIYPNINFAPLTSGHTYGLVLTAAAVRSASGAAATQDADLAAVLGAARPGDDSLGKAWDAYAKLRAWLPSGQVQPAAVINAAVFTVGDPTATMQKLATAVAAQPAPVLSSLFLCGSSGTDACDDGTDARKCGAESANFVEIHGKIKLPIFQSGTAPYLRPSDGGNLNVVAGAVTKVRDEDVCFALTLPKGTAPEAGWPLVVYSHGTGGSFRSFIRDGIADRLATSTPKIAAFSFDSVGHGARRNGLTKSPEELVFNVQNPRAARDNFAQGAADLLTAFRLPSATGTSGFTPTIKFPAKVLFFGHSQGSTHGALALPFTDDAPAAVLSGAGANLIASLLEKTSPSDIAVGLTFLLGETPDAGHPMMTVWQQFFDPADPANYNRLTIGRPVGSHKAKHVLMTWGTKDTYTPESTLLWNAMTLGLPTTPEVLEPHDDFKDLVVPRPISKNLGGTTTGVFIQYARGDADGHFVAWKNPQALNDWTAFVTSFFASGGTPTIPSLP